MAIVEGYLRELSMTRTSKASKSQRAENRRGSPEAIEKRRAARHFNDVLGGGGANKLDGRTEKRRQRLLKELEAGTGRGSRELKPLDVLQHVEELIDLGEPLSSIRKVAKVRKHAVPDDSMVRVIAQLHKAYNFRPEVYRFVGVTDDVLRSAGVLNETGSRLRVRAKAGSKTGPNSGPNSRRGKKRAA